MASIRKAKKLAKKQGKVFISPSKASNSLRILVQQQINEVNKRLRSLERSGNYGTFASKKLFERLDSKKLSLLQKSKKVNKGHVLRVKLKPNMTTADLTATSKAALQFLKSATSTPKKLKSVMEKTKKSMYETLKTQGKEVTKEDIEAYYEMLGNKDFDYFNEKIGASAMWSIIEDAINYEDTEKGFLSRLNNYLTLNDVDIQVKAKRLYEKYVI